MTYRAMSVRVLFLAAHLTAVVLLAAYSAGLISSLTMESVNLPFSTFEELLNAGTHAVGVVNNSAAVWLFTVRPKTLASLITCSQSLHVESRHFCLLGSQIWLSCNSGKTNPTKRTVQLKDAVRLLKVINYSHSSICHFN
jgi:hypothetical protein